MQKKISMGHETDYGPELDQKSSHNDDKPLFSFWFALSGK